MGWCGTNAMLGREAAEHALQWSEKHGRDAAAIFDDAIALRETIYRICFAMADGKTPEARDVAAINAALDGAPERRVLAHREKTFGGASIVPHSVRRACSHLCCGPLAT